MATDFLTLFCTCPDTATGERIASALIDEHLAACVNLSAHLRSFYRWQGRVHDDNEVLLIIKTAAARYDAIETRVKALHPDDVPEIIALPIERGSQDYLAWLRQATGGQ